MQRRLESCVDVVNYCYVAKFLCVQMGRYRRSLLSSLFFDALIAGRRAAFDWIAFLVRFRSGADCLLILLSSTTAKEGNNFFQTLLTAVKETEEAADFVGLSLPCFFLSLSCYVFIVESSDPIFVQLLFLILHFPLSFKGSNRQLQVILIRNVRVCQVLFNLARRKTSQPVNDVLHMLFFNRLFFLHKTLLKIVLIIFTFLLRVKI